MSSRTRASEHRTSTIPQITFKFACRLVASPLNDVANAVEYTIKGSANQMPFPPSSHRLAACGILCAKDPSMMSCHRTSSLEASLFDHRAKASSDLLRGTSFNPKYLGDKPSTRGRKLVLLSGYSVHVCIASLEGHMTTPLIAHVSLIWPPMRLVLTVGVL